MDTVERQVLEKQCKSKKTVCILYTVNLILSIACVILYIKVNNPLCASIWGITSGVWFTTLCMNIGEYINIRQRIKEDVEEDV